MVCLQVVATLMNASPLFCTIYGIGHGCGSCSGLLLACVQECARSLQCVRVWESMLMCIAAAVQGFGLIALAVVVSFA